MFLKLIGLLTVTALSLVSCRPNDSLTLSGAGASFPAPLYQRWFAEYHKANPLVKIGYQSVGSGAGVNQFINGTVDFAASDVAMTEAEISKVKRGAVLLPVTAGAIVIGFNLPGIEELSLSREALAGMFLGKIKTWNHPAIAATNPGINLPNLPIAVVHRSDGSGTTGIFTMHLSAISPEWKNGPGTGKSISWPVGVGTKGNEGVTAQIMQIQGAIGYVEVSFARQNHLKTAALENKSGQFQKYSAHTAASALANIDLPESLIAFNSDPEGSDSYPIVSYSWMLIYKQYDDQQKADALRKMLIWAVTNGQQLSDQLGYIPIPDEVEKRILKAVENLQ